MSWFGRKQTRELGLVVSENGSLARTDVIYVDGEVVDERYYEDRWRNVWEYFYANGATVGGNEWEKKYKKEYVDNGRVYDPSSGRWEYTEAAGGNVDPFQVNYKAAQDYQGSVPCWDGYSGE